MRRPNATEVEFAMLSLILGAFFLWGFMRLVFELFSA